MAKEQAMIPAPRRVYALQFGYLFDSRSRVTFHELTVKHPTEGGHKVQMGVATEVPEDVVARWYYGHPNFHLEGYDLDEMAELRSKLEGPMHHASPGGTAAAAPPAPAIGVTEPVTTPPPAPTEAPAADVAPADASTEPVTTPPPAPAALEGVKLNDQAAETAKEMGLVAADFATLLPSGKDATYTVADVRKAKAEKDKLAATS